MSTLVKMSHCWKSRVATHILFRISTYILKLLSDPLEWTEPYLMNISTPASSIFLLTHFHDVLSLNTCLPFSGSLESTVTVLDTSSSTDELFGAFVRVSSLELGQPMLRENVIEISKSAAIECVK